MPKFLIIILIISGQVFAMKACPENSFYTINNQPNIKYDWEKNSSWVAKISISNIRSESKAYPNCSMNDRSKCATRLVGTFDKEILNVIKGSAPVDLQEDFCSKLLPTVPGTYIFYGLRPNKYMNYIKQ